MPDKVRFAILGTRGIPAAYGGFETFAENISTRLAAAGVDVTVFCIKGLSPSAPDEYNGVRLEYVPSPHCGPLTTILFDLVSLWRARKDFDVVYMLGYGASLFCFLPRLWGASVWINMDGIEWARSKWSWPARAWLKLMEAVALRTANVIIADADAIGDHLHARHRRVPQLHVIPYGARLVDRPPDPAPLVRWGLEPHDYYLMVCRLEPENHVRELIEGYLLSASRAPLIVVGGRDLPTRYVRELVALDGPRVRFIGSIYDADVMTCLRYYCRAYFHGHSVGGTNPSLLEALGCGNMILAHDNPFNREVAGDAAWFIAGPAQIAGVIALLEGMGTGEQGERRERARRRIRERYTWESVAERYMQMLHRPAARARD